MADTKKKNDTLFIMTRCGILAAMAVILYYIEIPVVAFYKLDLSTLPAILAGFAMGPIPGVAVVVIKNLVHMLGTSTACVGELADIIMSSCFIIPASLIYRSHKNKKGAAVSMLIGTALMTIAGVLVNYFGEAKGQPLFILLGVVLIVVAIVLNGMAYRKMLKGTQKVPAKGIGISIAAGIIMAFFYRFVAASMDLTDFAHPAAGKLTPYTAVFVFAVGVFASNFIFNTIAMKRPVEGPPIRIGGYFRGSAGTHMVGMVGGMIWCLGQSFSMIASGQAGAAISYGLGQGATLVSALWGILVWKEVRSAPAVSKRLNLTMFILFVIGLGFLVYAGA